MRGRRPAGAEYVAKLTGADEAKHRLSVILRTLSGECRVAEACELLGVGMSRFHELRHEALQAALDALTTRPPGRPPALPPDPRVAALERQLEGLRVELEAAKAREEVALALPALAAKAASGKPGSRPKGRRRK